MRIRGRAAPGMTLALTLGMAVSLAALWLFGALAEDVVNHDPLFPMDRTISTWFQVHASPAGNAIAIGVSALGAPLTMTCLAIGVGLFLAIRRHWVVLVGWVAGFAGGMLLGVALKLLIRRPRPSHVTAYLFRESWSFPSGHAMGSLIGYGMLAYVALLFWIHPRRRQLAVLIGAALLVMAIGLSRIALGVHYSSDVMAGYAAGLIWLVACISGVEIARSPRTLASGTSA